MPRMPQEISVQLFGQQSPLFSSQAHKSFPGASSWLTSVPPRHLLSCCSFHQATSDAVQFLVFGLSFQRTLKNHGSDLLGLYATFVWLVASVLPGILCCFLPFCSESTRGTCEGSPGPSESFQVTDQVWWNIPLLISNLSNTPIFATFCTYDLYYVFQKYFLLFFKNTVCFNCSQSCCLHCDSKYLCSIYNCVPPTLQNWGLVLDKLLLRSVSTATSRLNNPNTHTK